MKNFCNKLRRDLDLRIARIERGEGDMLCKSQEAIRVAGEAMRRLKDFTVGYEFRSEQEEIHFFKHLKPSVYSILIYYGKIERIELNMPLGSDEMQLAYLKKEYERIKDYFERHLDFFHYFRSRLTHLDRCFFMRGEQNDSGQSRESLFFDRDPRFSTCYDYKVAKIMACERLAGYLKEECRKLGHCQAEAAPDEYREKQTWTASKIDLIELIYAVHADGSTNHGRTAVAELAKYAESCLNVSLGRNVPRNFLDICLRSNPTQYLDRLKEALLKKIDEMNRYAPKRKK